MSKYLAVKYLLVPRKLTPKIKLFKKLIFGGPYARFPGAGGGVASNYVEIFLCKISTVIKKHWLPKLSCLKN